MQERLDKLYDEITDIENAIEEVETRLYNIRQDKISEDNVYQFLLFFDKLYDKFTDLEKKTFLKSFLSDVFIYEEEQKDGRILKGLRFKFPIYMNGRNVLGVDRDNESTDETVVALHHQSTDCRIPKQSNIRRAIGEHEKCNRKQQQDSGCGFRRQKRRLAIPFVFDKQ